MEYYSAVTKEWNKPLHSLPELGMLQEGGPPPFQGPRVGSRLTLGKELSEETHELPKQETWLGRGAQMESRGVRNPGERLCLVACSPRFYGDGITFWILSAQSFWLRVLLGGTCVSQPRRMPERRIPGKAKTRGVSFWPFLNSPNRGMACQFWAPSQEDLMS